MDRKNISSGAPWESMAGYSRAVVVGPFVSVAGTIAVGDDGQVVAPGDAYQQTRFILDKIAKVLAEAGCGMAAVVRTRMYITDIGTWQAVTKAHGEVFQDIRPAATLLAVSDLIDPQAVVEIEVDAIAPTA